MADDNTSDNPTFARIVTARLSRRDVLRGAATDHGLLPYEPWANALRSFFAGRSAARQAALYGMNDEIAAVPWLRDLSTDVEGRPLGVPDQTAIVEAAGCGEALHALFVGIAERGNSAERRAAGVGRRRRNAGPGGRGDRLRRRRARPLDDHLPGPADRRQSRLLLEPDRPQARLSQGEFADIGRRAMRFPSRDLL